MEITRSEISARILPLLRELVHDLDQEEWEAVDEETRLIEDLGLTSVEFVDFFVAIEKAFGRSIGFHELLMVDGKYIADLRIGGLVDYLDRKLNAGEAASAAAPEIPPQQGPVSSLDEGRVASFLEIVPRPGEAAPAEPKNPRAVFLISAPRSGSTLLQVILAGHPKLFAPPELHLLWFSDLAHRRSVYSQDSNKHLVSGAVRAVMALYGISEQAAVAFMQRCEEQGMGVPAFYALLQQRLGERMLVDKTPSYAYSPETLQRAERDFDRPLFVHLVRHPCGMFRSFTDAKLERTAPFMARNADRFSGEEFAELAWLVSNRNITRFLEGVPAERQTRVHYEDLVTDPRTTLEGVCRFLGIELDPEMLDPYGDKDRRMAGGLSQVSQMSGDLKFHLHGRIDPDSAERWRRYIGEDAVSEITWDLAEQMGYRRR